MDRQEVYDWVTKHLLAQGVRSVDFDGCLYRGPNGTSCAVGCLILDEHYSPEWNNAAVDALPVMGALMASGVDVEYRWEMLDLLLDLQSVHDTADPNKWDVELRRLARRHGLEPHGVSP